MGARKRFIEKSGNISTEFGGQKREKNSCIKVGLPFDLNTMALVTQIRTLLFQQKELT